MRTQKRHRPRIGERLAAWSAIFALVIQVALPEMLAAATAGASASPTGIVICTADGLERIARAADESEPKLPVSGTQTPCPICLAAQSPMIVPADGIEPLVGAPALEEGERMPRPPCRVTESPPARAPPNSA
jgi:hypothetical protein